jgi:hypothetical protein
VGFGMVLLRVVGGFLHTHCLKRLFETLCLCRAFAWSPFQ